MNTINDNNLTLTIKDLMDNSTSVADVIEEVSNNEGRTDKFNISRDPLVIYKVIIERNTHSDLLCKQ